MALPARSLRLQRRLRGGCVRRARVGRPHKFFRHLLQTRHVYVRERVHGLSFDVQHIRVRACATSSLTLHHAIVGKTDLVLVLRREHERGRRRGKPKLRRAARQLMIVVQSRLRGAR